MPNTPAQRRAAALAAALTALAVSACSQQPDGTPAQAAREWASAACNNDVDRLMELVGGRLATFDRRSWEVNLTEKLVADGCDGGLVFVTPQGSGTEDRRSRRTSTWTSSTTTRSSWTGSTRRAGGSPP